MAITVVVDSYKVTGILDAEVGRGEKLVDKSGHASSSPCFVGRLGGDKTGELGKVVRLALH